MSDDIKRKIAALLKMTSRAGCTEAEAMAAAEKAAYLMREHGLSEADILFTKADIRSKSSGGGMRDRLWVYLAANTNTALIFSDGKAVFVGKEPGPEIAVYLYTVIDRAIDRAVADFKSTQNYRRRKSLASKRRAVQDFTAAMTTRVMQKLRDHFAGVRSEQAHLAAVAARDAMFPNSHRVKTVDAKLRNKNAISAGLAAGEKVGLRHGMGPHGEQLRIGA